MSLSQSMWSDSLDGPECPALLITYCCDSFSDLNSLHQLQVIYLLSESWWQCWLPLGKAVDPDNHWWCFFTEKSLPASASEPVPNLWNICFISIEQQQLFKKKVVQCSVTHHMKVCITPVTDSLMNWTHNFVGKWDQAYFPWRTLTDIFCKCNYFVRWSGVTSPNFNQIIVCCLIQTSCQGSFCSQQSEISPPAAESSNLR